MAELAVKRNPVQKRIAVFIFALVGLIFILAGRVAWIQVVQGDLLAMKAKRQVEESRTLQSPRGTIYDRNGRELAVSILVKSLYVDPEVVKDTETLAAELAPILKMSEQDIRGRIADGGRFVWLKRMLEPDVVARVKAVIEKDNLNCLNFVEESKRYYPNDALASQVLGFVGMDDVGLDGMELAEDEVLKAKSSEQFLSTDTYGRPIFNSVFSKNTYEGGKDLYLTIDSNIQFIVEQTIEKAMVDTKPRAVTAVVMNPKNGEILAMANRPTYNPNEFYKYSPEEWRNRAVSFVYEPGSTFKAIVAASALQEGIVTPEKRFVDPGYVMVSGRRIQNWNGESYGNVSFTDIIKNSINTGFVQVGMQVGAQKLNDYAHAFGFGALTGIELPGEEYGILFDPKHMRDSDIATMSIGQSIAVTPVQLATAISAIANKGMLLKPTIIKEFRNSDGSISKSSEVTQVRQVIEEDTATKLISMLEQVVASGGGTKAAVKGYRIAGKTGTAEKLKDDGSGYLSGHYIASFAGFAPVEDPQITVLVIIDDPNGIYYGGQIAAPIAGEIFEQVLRYLNIKPLNNDLEGAPVKRPLAQLQQPAKPIQVPPGKVLVPDFTGKTMRQVAELADSLSLIVLPEGSGIAQRQSIPVNTLVDNGAEITVYFTGI